MTDTSDAEIRDRSYFMWIGAGRPECQAQIHWHKAAVTVRLHAAPVVGAIPAAPKAARGQDKATGTSRRASKALPDQPIRMPGPDATRNREHGRASLDHATAMAIPANR